MYTVYVGRLASCLHLEPDLEGAGVASTQLQTKLSIRYTTNIFLGHSKYENAQ